MATNVLPVHLEPLHLAHTVVGYRGPANTPGLVDMMGLFWSAADLVAAVTHWAAVAHATFRPLFATPTEEATHYAAVLTAQYAREAYFLLLAQAKLPPGQQWPLFPHSLTFYIEDPTTGLREQAELSTPEQTARTTVAACWTCGDRLSRPHPRHGADCVICTLEWAGTVTHFATRHRNG
jgi:hypothetical protein